jgi:hypothetical protein
MKKIFLFFFWIFIVEIGFSQNVDSLRIEKIVIWDAVRYCAGGKEKKYEILLENGTYKLYDINVLNETELEKLISQSHKKYIDKLRRKNKHQEADNEYEKIRNKYTPKIFIQVIDNQLVKCIYDALQMPTIKHPLGNFGIDNEWLVNRADSIYNLYVKSKIKTTPQEDSLALKNLKDYFLVYTKMWERIERGRDDHFFVRVDIYTNQNNHIGMAYSEGGFPWIRALDDTYNYHISWAIAQLLPDKPIINKQRLQRFDFIEYLVESVCEIKK